MYFLARHAFLCADTNYIVILDIRRDEYCGIPRVAADALAEHIAGWPLTCTPARQHPSSVEDANVLQRLLARGVLTQDFDNGKEAIPVEVPAPTASLIDQHDGTDLPNPTPSPISVMRFIRACFRARAETRLQRFERIVASHARLSSESVLTPPDLSRARALVCEFEWMRPVLFTSTRQCLYYSVSMRRFLSLSGVRVKWVFGVQFEPFHAHCWLQQGDVVFNDTVESVRRFAPIMVV